MKTVAIVFLSGITVFTAMLLLAALIKIKARAYRLPDCENDDEYLGESTRKDLLRKIQVDQKLTYRLTNQAYYEQRVN